MATTSPSIDTADARAVGSSAASAGAFDRVLLAAEGDTDERVHEVAVSLAAAHGAELDALSVVPMDVSVDHWDMVVERREDEAEAALDAVDDAGRETDVPVRKQLRYGTPAEEIGLYADGNDVGDDRQGTGALGATDVSPGERVSFQIYRPLDVDPSEVARYEVTIQCTGTFEAQGVYCQ